MSKYEYIYNIVQRIVVYRASSPTERGGGGARDQTPIIVTGNLQATRIQTCSLSNH
jgi:hypothetical protein